MPNLFNNSKNFIFNIKESEENTLELIIFY